MEAIKLAMDSVDLNDTGRHASSHASLETLPTELLLQIIEDIIQLSGKRGLSPISCASKRLRTLAEPLMYEYVNFSRNSVIGALEHARTLFGRPGLFQHVRHLCFDPGYQNPDYRRNQILDFPHSNPDFGVSMRSSLTQWAAAEDVSRVSNFMNNKILYPNAVMLSAAMQSSNLVSLTLNSDIFCLPLFQRMAKSAYNQGRAFRRLSSLWLYPGTAHFLDRDFAWLTSSAAYHRRHRGPEQWEKTDLSFWVRHHALRTLGLDFPDAHVKTTALYRNVEQMPTSASQIESLTIGQLSHISLGRLETVLHRLPKLRTFRQTLNPLITPSDGRSEFFDSARLIAAFGRTQPVELELHFSLSTRAQRYSKDATPMIRLLRPLDLSVLVCLKKLTIESEILLGGFLLGTFRPNRIDTTCAEEGDRNAAEQVARNLPSSLEVVTIFGVRWLRQLFAVFDFLNYLILHCNEAWPSMQEAVFHHDHDDHEAWGNLDDAIKEYMSSAWVESAVESGFRVGSVQHLRH